MKCQMFADKALNEEVAVIVTGLHAQGEIKAFLLGDLGQGFRLELLVQESIRFALINQNWRAYSMRLKQFDRVVLRPR